MQACLDPVGPATWAPLRASVPGPYGVSGTGPAPAAAAHARTPSAHAPRPGEPGTLWLGFPCGRKELVVGGGGERAAPAGACLDFGASTGVSVALGPERVAFADDACAPLAAAHALGPGPLYLFLGAECAGAECEGWSPPAALQAKHWSKEAPRWTGPSLGTALPALHSPAAVRVCNTLHALVESDVRLCCARALLGATRARCCSRPAHAFPAHAPRARPRAS
jgi:hypothetical protein